MSALLVYYVKNMSYTDHIALRYTSIHYYYIVVATEKDVLYGIQGVKTATVISVALGSEKVKQPPIGNFTVCLLSEPI